MSTYAQVAAGAAHPLTVNSSTLVAELDLVALACDQFRDRAEFQHLREDSSLRLELVPIPGHTSKKILCDVSTGVDRPLVPSSWTGKIFSHFHGLHHPGGKSTLREVRRRFVWFRMSSEILSRARACQDCHASKVARHVRAPLQRRVEPDHRFSALHVDLVGPLPPSEGMRYLLTIVDRYSRWMEAIPLPSMTARDCADALIRHWISRFGVPSDITTDQGRQFCSSLWQELHKSLGIKSLRTTSYHPQANGMVERLHRTLKERLMACAPASDWMSTLPLVLLGLRSSVREDSGTSPAELVFGTVLRLPGQMLPEVSPESAPPTADFVRDLEDKMKRCYPSMPVLYHGSRPSHLPASLQSSTHVYVRVDAVHPPLSRPYEGPYQVLQHGDKTFSVDKSGRPWRVSVDRLKPAFYHADRVSSPSSSTDQHDDLSDLSLIHI